MTDILAHISEKLLSYQQANPTVKRWVVAYSGGVDSTVLLHTIHQVNQQLSKPCAVVAVHINHQLSPSSSAWQYHCEQFSQTLNIDFYTQSVEVKNTGQGVEAAARYARYAIFESFLEEGDCLLLGQHQQDQAETLLLRLLRGAGVRGLSAMSSQRRLGDHDLLRPLLSVDKKVLVDYANENQLSWVEDESNIQDTYDRNFLRQHIFPRLQERWATVNQQLSDTTLRMQQADALLTEVAQDDFKTLYKREERWGTSIDFSKIATLSVARRNNVLRYWCEQYDFPVLEESHLEQIQQQFFVGSALLSSACVSWKGCELRQFNGRLYMMASLPIFSDSKKVMQWAVDTSLSMGAPGELEIKENREEGLLLPKLNYEVRWRQGGERCTPVGRQHSQTVKKLLQEYGLEAWLRDRIPLLYCDNELAAVGDLWVNKGFSPKAGQHAIRFSWKL